MILSNQELHKAINEGRLLIDPEPQPRIPSLGVDCPYDTHSVNLKLGDEILVPKESKYCIDLSKTGSLPEAIKANSDTFKITKEQPYHLEPHKFILASTLEKISLPTKERPYLAARIEGKSSRARLGLIVHCTAPTVHPGFSGKLTLEMVNFGPIDIILKPQMYIAQLIVEQVFGEIQTNLSQFQNQTSPSGL
ncbi:MAG: dCTP deaminase [Sedimentisphaerales bacterium]